jgi:sulfur relay (sulfurtransferase) DsrC/TusE family protein
MAWVVVCGKALAGHSSVVGYEQGAVQIEVQETAWLDEIRNMSEHLARELARVAGMKVTKLHLIVKR